MNDYLDIKVLPDLETTAQTLLNNLFAKLHRQLGAGQIGVSFPQVSRRTLGDTLRIHGQSDHLHQLMQVDWIAQLKDYVRCGEILAVPEQTQHRCVRRIQIKSMHNKRSRSVRKGWLTQAQALEQMPDHLERGLNLPFIQTRSLSNGQTLRIYIEHGAVQDQAQPGKFSSYGLSSTTTIPWF